MTGARTAARLPGAICRLYEPVVVRREVPAPPDEVYAVLAEPSTYPDWLVGAQRIRNVDRRFPAPGAGFEHTVGAPGPLQVDDSTRSAGADPGRHLALVAKAGAFRARVEFDLEPDGPGGTLVSFREQPLWPVAALTPLLRQTLVLRNEASLRRLAERFGG